MRTSISLTLLASSLLVVDGARMIISKPTDLLTSIPFDYFDRFTSLFSPDNGRPPTYYSLLDIKGLLNQRYELIMDKDLEKTGQGEAIVTGLVNQFEIERSMSRKQDSWSAKYTSSIEGRETYLVFSKTRNGNDIKIKRVDEINRVNEILGFISATSKEDEREGPGRVYQVRLDEKDYRCEASEMMIECKSGEAVVATLSEKVLFHISKKQLLINIPTIGEATPNLLPTVVMIMLEQADLKRKRDEVNLYSVKEEEVYSDDYSDDEEEGYSDDDSGDEEEFDTDDEEEFKTDDEEEGYSDEEEEILTDDEEFTSDDEAQGYARPMKNKVEVAEQTDRMEH